MTSKHLVTVLGKVDCCLCDKAIVLVERLKFNPKIKPFDLEYVNIVQTKYNDDFFNQVPVILIDGNIASKMKIDTRKLSELLRKD